MAYDTALTNRDSAKQSLELLQKGPRKEQIEAARKEVEAAAAGLDQAQAGLAQAQERLSYTAIRSPLAGVVWERSVDPGNIATPGPPLLRVADPSSVYFEARVPERAGLQVRQGQPVEVSVQGDGDYSVPGKVDRLVPVADPSSRDFLVRISLADDSRVSRPGMFARGAVVVQQRPDAVVVPKDAVVERDGKPFLFVVKAGKARQCPVEVGLTDRTNAEIRSGLRPGESVVIVGAEGLKDGDPVHITQSGGS